MTRTEERLTDALAAVGRSVRPETLPPLPTAARRCAEPVGAVACAGRRRQRRPRGGCDQRVHLFSGRPTGAAGIGPPPRHYVTEESMGIQVRDTATGAVTARLPRPFSAPRYFGMYANVVAAGDGDREFVAEYTGTPPHSTVVQTRLYSFHVTGAAGSPGWPWSRAAARPLHRGHRAGRLTGRVAGRDRRVSHGGQAQPAPCASDHGDQPPDGRAQPLGGRPAARGPVPQHLEHLLGARRWLPGLPRPVVPWLAPRDLRDRAAFQPGPDAPRCPRGRATLRRQCPAQPVGPVRLSGPGAARPGRQGPHGRRARPAVPGAGPFGIAGPPGGPGAAPRRGRGAAALSRRAGAASCRISEFRRVRRHLLLAWAQNGSIDHGRLRPLPPQGGVAFTDAW